MAKLGGRTVGPALNQAAAQRLEVIQRLQRTNAKRLHGPRYLSPHELVALSRGRHRSANTHPHKRGRS